MELVQVEIVHPLLDARFIVCEFPETLGATASPDWLVEKLSLSSSAPVESNDGIRKLVRDLLRFGGFKPTGRSKPASEYLLKAAEAEKLTSINAAVDLCNVVSLHSGLPISVVDCDLAKPPYHLGIADSGASYVFNRSGQEIDIGGLLCLFDSHGPCANGVKDSQRTKTHDGTSRTLSIVWGTNQLSEHVAETEVWYRELIAKLVA